jgi:hypothetical protein
MPAFRRTRPALAATAAAAALLAGAPVAAPAAGTGAQDPDAKARRLYVRAEQLRRSGPCDPFVGLDFEEGYRYRRRPWRLLPEVGRFPQLRPLYPALAELEAYDAERARLFFGCLRRWKRAAALEQRMLLQYPGTEIAAIVATLRRLTPTDVARLIDKAAELTPHGPDD